MADVKHADDKPPAKDLNKELLQQVMSPSGVYGKVISVDNLLAGVKRLGGESDWVDWKKYIKGIFRAKRLYSVYMELPEKYPSADFDDIFDNITKEDLAPYLKDEKTLDTDFAKLDQSYRDAAGQAWVLLYGALSPGVSACARCTRRQGRSSVEQVAVALRVRDDPEYKTAQGANVRKCYNCGVQGHLLRECPEPVKCKKCGKGGHVDRFCNHRANVVTVEDDWVF